MTTPLNELVKSREVEQAIAKAFEYMQKRPSKQSPSHSIGHMYFTAKRALREAESDGITDKKVLQDIFISGLYHDIIRSNVTISGLMDASVSAKKADSLLRKILPEERRKRIGDMITGNHEHAKYLFMADYVELTPHRAYSFGYYENPMIGTLMVTNPPERYEKELKRKEDELRKMGVSERKIAALREGIPGDMRALDKRMVERWGPDSKRMRGERGAAVEINRMHKAVNEVGSLFPSLKKRFKMIFLTKGEEITKIPRRPIYELRKGKIRRPKA